MRAFLSYHRAFLTLLLFFVVTVAFMLPVIRAPYTTVYDDYDGVFVPWEMNWSLFAITHKPLELYNAPIFAPLPLTTTYSDPLFTGGLLAAPFVWQTGEPLIASTVNLLFAFIGTAWFTYLVAYELTKRQGVSFLAGLIASFSATHLHYLGHLHVFMIEFIPLGLFAWLRYRHRLRLRWLVVLFACFLLQVLNSPLSGYLFVFSFLPFLFEFKTWIVLKKKWKLIMTCGVISLTIALLLLLPYFIAAKLYDSERTLRDAANFSLSVLDLFDLYRVSILTLATLGWALISWKKLRGITFGFVITALIGFIFTLGPALKWGGKTVKIPFPIPMPYAAAYYILPGFHAFRTPSRWMVLPSFMLALGFAMLMQNAKGKVFYLSGLIVINVLCLESLRFRQTYTVPSRAQRPAVYAWLEQSNITAVAHVPPYVYNMPQGKLEPWRMLFSLPDHRSYSMYDGYSGFAPQDRVTDMIIINQTFPSQHSIDLMKENGVQGIVVHLDELTPEQRQAFGSLLLNRSYKDATTEVIRL